jgi:site-specific DNA-methyltransferase (adenine-specific)
MKRKDAKCTVLHGDCLDLMRTFADRSVHAVITDPPYGSTDCHWDKRFDLGAWWEQVDRVSTETSVVVCFAAPRP